MRATIVFNGKKYNDAAEMPEADRREYERAMQGVAPLLADADGNGIPRLLERRRRWTSGSAVVTTTFVVNGRTYASLDEVPAELRSAYERALREGGAPLSGEARVEAVLSVGPHSISNAGRLDPIVRRALLAAAGAVLIALAIWSLLRA